MIHEIIIDIDRCAAGLTENQRKNLAEYVTDHLQERWPGIPALAIANEGINPENPVTDSVEEDQEVDAYVCQLIKEWWWYKDKGARYDRNCVEKKVRDGNFIIELDDWSTRRWQFLESYHRLLQSVADGSYGDGYCKFDYVVERLAENIEVLETAREECKAKNKK